MRDAELKTRLSGLDPSLQWRNSHKHPVYHPRRKPIFSMPGSLTGPHVREKPQKRRRPFSIHHRNPGDLPSCGPWNKNPWATARDTETEPHCDWLHLVQDVQMTGAPRTSSALSHRGATSLGLLDSTGLTSQHRALFPGSCLS